MKNTIEHLTIRDLAGIAQRDGRELHIVLSPKGPSIPGPKCDHWLAHAGPMVGLGLCDLLDRYIASRVSKTMADTPKHLGAAFDLFALLHAAKTWHEGL